MADKKVNVLFIGGGFNNSGGKTSLIAREVYKVVDRNFDIGYCQIGGYFNQLREILNQIHLFQLIFWFADAPNHYPKVIQEIKKLNKECVLVTSKRNIEKDYSFADVIWHALGLKSNLLLEVIQREKRYFGRVVDPLGNIFIDFTEDFTLIAEAMVKRAKELLSFTRVSSQRAGNAVIQVPDEREFFAYVKFYADKFHQLIHPAEGATTRFMGNASFRCESGFPSFKNAEFIFVTRRNVDKRQIDRKSFVAVRQTLPVEFFGDHKPSVDTPIQIELYNHYHKVRYMLHSHVYVDGAAMTERVIPCGALEEFEEIRQVYLSEDKVNFAINLRGHGSLVLASSVDFFEDLPYIARPTPELIEEYVY